METLIAEEKSLSQVNLYKVSKAKFRDIQRHFGATMFTFSLYVENVHLPWKAWSQIATLLKNVHFGLHIFRFGRLNLGSIFPPLF